MSIPAPNPAPAPGPASNSTSIPSPTSFLRSPTSFTIPSPDPPSPITTDHDVETFPTRSDIIIMSAAGAVVVILTYLGVWYLKRNKNEHRKSFDDNETRFFLPTDTQTSSSILSGFVQEGYFYEKGQWFRAKKSAMKHDPEREHTIFDEVSYMSPKRSRGSIDVPIFTSWTEFSSVCVLHNLSHDLGEPPTITITFKANWRGRSVVIKPKETNDLGGMNELCTLNRIRSSSNISKLLAICTDFTNPALKTHTRTCTGLVFQFLKQGDVRKYILNSDTLDERDYVNIIIGMARGIQCLHSSNIVHCNIHLGNFLMSDDGRVLLSDFEHSHQIDVVNKYSLEESDEIHNWRHCAPETLETRTHTLMSDIWMFGVSIWELYNHEKVPFGIIDSPQELLEQKDVTLTLPEICSPTLHEILNSCCERDTKKRITINDTIMRLQNETVGVMSLS